MCEVSYDRELKGATIAAGVLILLVAVVAVVGWHVHWMDDIGRRTHDQEQEIISLKRDLKNQLEVEQHYEEGFYRYKVQQVKDDFKLMDRISSLEHGPKP